MKAANNLVGTQLYGWGQFYRREGKDLNEHLDEALAAIRDCGYDFAEGFLDAGRPERNAGFAEKLRSHGMAPVSLYSGGRLHEKGQAEETVRRLLAAAKACKEAGFLILNLNPDPIGREKTADELKVQAAALDDLGRGLVEMEMLLGIHNHTPAMRNDAREFHYNFKHTSPELVGFCFDTHWVYRGGVPPMKALREYHERVVSWHLRQSRDKVWIEELADGDIDYRQIAEFARQHEMPAPYIVEVALEGKTEVTRSVVENHRRSREYVRRVFGV